VNLVGRERRLSWFDSFRAHQLPPFSINNFGLLWGRTQAGIEPRVCRAQPRLVSTPAST